MKAQPGDYLLLLRPQPCDGWPAAVRLRQALKVLLRRFRLRCLCAEELAEGMPVPYVVDGSAGPGDTDR